MNCDQQNKAWLGGLRDDLAGFMDSLRVEGQPGRFLPCVQGATGAGRTACLGFSCLANKIYYTIGLWDKLGSEEQRAWLDLICSFQGNTSAQASFWERDAFVDQSLLDAIPLPKERLVRRVMGMFSGRQKTSPRSDAVLAETKQAIATLAQVGMTPRRPFLGFPLEERELLLRMRRLNWSLPWGAGAKTALLAVFIQAQGARLEGVNPDALGAVVVRFLESMADKETGGYFLPPRCPPRGQLINGAMKVLNALDWLGEPVQYPVQLIDTCLLQGPPPAGCHVVDWVYVVHRCLMQTDHRRHEVQMQCLEIIQLIRSHQSGDRGFSYAPGQAQKGYYGAEISLGLDEGDIHGTCLLSWAIAMILDILEWGHFGWKVIRP
ncbi:MAG: hypothetical protein H7839_04065 [Magnetococcus sp. YQC-5]